MGVDQNGFIQTIVTPPFQEAFRPLLDHICQQLSTTNLPCVHSVYVYGSVATGQAVAGHSDLDLSIILHAAPTSDEAADLEQIRREAETACPVVSKIDFDIGLLSEVLPSEAGLAWKYWLRHHCRCLLGEDLSLGIGLFRPSRQLALAVNGDFERVLGHYRTSLSGDISHSTADRLMREASRKLIRSTNVLRHHADIDWPDTLDAHANRLRDRFPFRRDDIDYFLTQALTPQDEPAAFTVRLQSFVDWMAVQNRNFG
jgi:hypothetical protein